MNKVRIFSCLVFLSGGFPALWGQAAESGVSILPVMFPKGPANWTVTFQKDGSKSGDEIPRNASGTRSLRQINVVRTENMRRDTMIWSDGTTSEFWWPGNSEFVVYQVDPDSPITVRRGGAMGDYRLDESTFGWVTGSNFQGVKTFLGKQCRYYEMPSPVEENEKRILQAWIDEKTGMPVGYRSGYDIAIFKFSEAKAEGLLVMPEKFQKKLKNVEGFFTPSKPQSNLKIN